MKKKYFISAVLGPAIAGFVFGGLYERKSASPTLPPEVSETIKNGNSNAQVFTYNADDTLNGIYVISPNPKLATITRYDKGNTHLLITAYTNLPVRFNTNDFSKPNATPSLEQ